MVLWKPTTLSEAPTQLGLSRCDINLFSYRDKPFKQNVLHPIVSHSLPIWHTARIDSFVSRIKNKLSVFISPV